MKTVLKDESKTFESPSEMDSASFRLFLQEELMRRCEKNPSYSMRAFARSLGCDIATLSKMISGQRGIGRISIEKMGQRLGLAPDQVFRFIEKRAGRKRSDKAGASLVPDYQQLTLDHFKIISDWYHYAILELMRMDHFRPDPKWISKTLGISISTVKVAIERLQRVEFLEITPEGNWVDLTGGTSTTIGSAFTASAFRKLQKQILEMAIVALEEVPMQKRDQTSITMAIDSSLIPEAKEKIKLFRRDLASFLSRGKKRDSVYHLGVSLYPITSESK